MKKVLVAMSGGVDSSVACLNLKREGIYCEGVTANFCCKEEENLEYVKRAKKVCEKINIKHRVLNLTKEFEKEVILKFIEKYKKGKTPNPCIMCNKNFKFGMLLNFAKSLNFTHLATGHYAKIKYSNERNRWLLKKSKNIEKDQSYFLYFLTQEQLASVIFPLEDLEKEIVRNIAKENSLASAETKESQDICFVGRKSYGEFIKNIAPDACLPGKFVDVNGKVLGEHKGIVNYTIGQRKGIGLSFKNPMFVQKINHETNEIVLTKEEELFETELYAKNINLVLFNSLEKKISCKAKVRYRQKESEAFVEQLDEDLIKVSFKTPQRAIAKGQAVVLYDYEDNVIGGGEIC